MYSHQMKVQRVNQGVYDYDVQHTELLVPSQQQKYA
jgi:hypothetical protein